MRAALAAVLACAACGSDGTHHLADAPGAVDAARDASGADGGSGTAATLFLPDDLNGAVYRYTMTPDADPTLAGSFAATLPAGAALGSDGELFVAEYSAAGTISRLATPLGALTATGTITGVGAHFPLWLRVVDGELWIVNTSDHACTTETEGIVRVAFDAQGSASVAGTLTTDLIGANRGVVFVPATRDLFVAQCHPVDVIQHFHVAADHTLTALPPLTGNGLSNPSGVVVAPWGELLVSNFGVPSGGAEILRFTLDAQGTATPNGTITGSGLDAPVDLAFTPWGELVAVNQGNASLSRFTFDAAHVATAKPNFPLVVPTQVTQFGVGLLAIVPGASQ